jgi:putative endonuclease
MAGLAGENAAAEWLAKRGFRILERNWRCRKYEIDLVAEHEGMMVFVEVKTRKNDDFGEPELFVTPAKQRRIISAAHFYLRDRDIALESRFDIVSVLLGSGPAAIHHLPDAFRALAK